LTESANGQLKLTSLCFFIDYSLSAFASNGIKHFTREEALAYVVSVEMVDFPLLHLQEEFEDEFGKSQQDNLFTMFVRRIRTQLIQLKEFIFIELYYKIVNFINKNINVNAKLKRSSSMPLNDMASSEEITRDEFNLNKLIVTVTSIGKVFGLYTGSNGRILWSFFLKNAAPFHLNKYKQEFSIPLYLQRSAAHFPHDPQCVLVCKYNTNDSIGSSSASKTLIYFFNPLTGSPSKDYPSEGLIVDYQIKQVFMSNVAVQNFLKPLIILDQENILHVLPEKSKEGLSNKFTKSNVIYLTGSSDQRNAEKTNTLIGYLIKFTSEVIY
jgi:ER membrane protein complex subunit 1